MTFTADSAVEFEAPRRTRPRTPVIDLVSARSRHGATSPSGRSAPDWTRTEIDDLTGLANRSRFVNLVEDGCAALTPDQPAALFLIDLDDFKPINDTWGHRTGDVVLVEIARRLIELLPTDVLIARLGADEFALWAPECSEMQCHAIAERVMTAIAKPILTESTLSIDASIGWVLAQESTSASSLLTRADIALHASKQEPGRRHTRFDPKLASQQVRSRMIHREIRIALDEGQFVLAGQAILNNEGRPIGREVLARWLHPRRGLLQPGDFLDELFAGGHAVEFDRMIMDLAIEEANRLPHGPPVWMNLTAESLNRDTVAYLVRAVATTGLDPMRLVVEISENASAETAETRRTIEEIAQLGFRVAIDDFGIGYSRLGVMASLPVSYVKIDRQFIHAIDSSDDAERICAAIVDLIHAIGAEVVGEGIERKEQADMLLSQGCEYLQGYFFERPQLIDHSQRP